MRFHGWDPVTLGPAVAVRRAYSRPRRVGRAARSPKHRPIWWPGPARRNTGRMAHALVRRRSRLCALLLAVVPIVVVASACGSLPSVPNPFAASATPRPTVAVPAQVTPTPRPAPTPVPEEAPVPFEPFWVQNHRITELWSGASGGPDTV